MKRILFCLLAIMFIVMMMAGAVFADSSGPTAISDYLSWEFLGSMAGAVAATTLIAQFCKFPLDKVWKIPTRFVVYTIALLILFAVNYFTGGITADNAILIILNAVIVAVAAMGTYEATFKKLEDKSKTG